jgi:hypothetical protein
MARGSHTPLLALLVPILLIAGCAGDHVSVEAEPTGASTVTTQPHATGLAALPQGSFRAEVAEAVLLAAGVDEESAYRQAAR